MLAWAGGGAARARVDVRAGARSVVLRAGGVIDLQCAITDYAGARGRA
jgi:hypothetical protein